MSFGNQIRMLRKARGLTLRQLAPKVGVGFTYLSKVENEKLDFGEYPSDSLICKLANVLDAEEEELLILAKRVPERIRKRVLQRPDVFTALARCDDSTLDKLMRQLSSGRQRKAHSR